MTQVGKVRARNLRFCAYYSSLYIYISSRRILFVIHKAKKKRKVLDKKKETHPRYTKKKTRWPFKLLFFIFLRIQSDIVVIILMMMMASME